jgi:cation transport ATPase
VCGTSVEPLRAREVLIFEDGFRFLCSATCRSRFLEGERNHEAAREAARSAAPLPSRPAPARHPRSVRRMAATVKGETSAAHRALSAPTEPPPWVGLAAAGSGVVLGAFAKNPILAVLATLAVCGAAAAALVRGWPARREVGWVGWAIGPAGALLAACGALFARGPGNDARLWLVGSAIAAGAVVVRTWLDARSSQPVTDVTSYLAAKMPVSVRVPVPSTEWALEMGSQEVPPSRVRAGQEVVVGEGEIAAVDGVVQGGEAFVLLHPSARTPVRRSTGDALLAGARVVEGEVRVLASRVGDERALVRPASFGDPRSHRSAPLTVLAARLTRWGGLLAVLGAAVGVLLSAGDAGLAGQLSAAAAVLLAAPLVAIRRASEAPYVAAAATAAERGVAFSSAHTLDRAGRTAVAALCTHGTITEGDPELVEVHAIGDTSAPALVGLVAGAEAAAEGHPIARAILRYAEAQRLPPESVRRATFLPGRGVTAVSPNGQELVVGNRALLLAEGVSVAVADADAARAEERGHTVVFVGLEGRVRAVISLRDEDRLGARAAVQRLIDLGVEVVLISGDHRGTVEALARHLDVGHVKAELLPDERGAEVRRLRETGGVVAVIGRPGHDDPALVAADVQLVLGAAGAAETDRAISLTSEDVRDAAAALWLARAARRAAWRGSMVAAVGGVFLTALAAFGLAAPAFAALLALAIDAYALPSAARLLRRIELRLPVRG